MSFRRPISLALTNTLKKITPNKTTPNKTYTKTTDKIQHKNILKHKYSSFWRFHHGDEI